MDLSSLSTLGKMRGTTRDQGAVTAQKSTRSHSPGHFCAKCLKSRYEKASRGTLWRGFPPREFVFPLPSRHRLTLHLENKPRKPSESTRLLISGVVSCNQDFRLQGGRDFWSIHKYRFHGQTSLYDNCVHVPRECSEMYRLTL